MQHFCGISLKPTEVIKDINLPSYWGGYIGQYWEMDKLQTIAANYWKPYMQETHISTEDATCYESNIAFQTPVKIVWQSCNELYLAIQSIRKRLKLRVSRCNYDKHKKFFLSYQKSKKK